jgi:serine/threonine protein kinase
VNPRAPAQPGDVVAGKYVVKNVIGRGGVGVVVAADHKTLRCPVAIKFLRPELAYEPKVVERFLREAHAAARLRSEHVARVMDADSTPEGAAYLVMELLEGRDFAQLLKDEGPLPVATAVDYVVQACDAVAEAHASGIVHRDLKSANLFLTRRADGAPLVKVLDFGLSKVDRTPSQASLTADDHVVGSPHFMSPEQMRSSREADARSDIWSLGVVLYTLLAGRVPFPGTYLTEVCSAVLAGSPPALDAVRPEVPAELAAVIARCLELEPEDRFQSVGELVAALAPFGRAVVAPASSRAAWVSPASASPPSTSERMVVPAPTPAVPLASPIAPIPRGRGRTALLAGAAVGALATAGVLLLRTGASPTASVPEPVPAAQPALGVSASRPDPSTPSATAATTTTAAPSPSSPPPPTVATAAPARTVVPRRGAAPVPRRASAPATPPATPPAAAPASPKPKTEDDVILGLPH